MWPLQSRLNRDEKFDGSTVKERREERFLGCYHNSWSSDTLPLHENEGEKITDVGGDKTLVTSCSVFEI